MRGKAGACKVLRCDYRITPACAGKSLVIKGQRLMMWDHPRVCGEKYSNLTDEEYSEGSPPRVRGKVTVNEEEIAELGITPACAGKSIRQGSNKPPAPDHPRVCGEKGILSHDISYNRGSPPRVRGKVPTGAFEKESLRITPACAGKRGLAYFVSPFPQDHPRVCGEKYLPCFTVVSMAGSPPRVRGKVLVFLLSTVH